MLGKAAGGAFIVAATTRAGYNTAKKFEQRKKNLNALESGIWLLKSDMDFSLSMLSVALKRVAGLVNKEISELFLISSEYLDRGYSAYDSFLNAINTMKKDLDFIDDDVKIVLDFAKNVGSGDIQCEIRNFDKTIERLKVNELLATENIKKYCKLYKTLGISAGILLVIMLI